MRGKKSYNIRNIEAHINHFALSPANDLPLINPINTPTFLLNKKMSLQQNFSTNNDNLNINNNEQTYNEYINSKYGVSKYASNLVSGKMFKKI